MMTSVDDCVQEVVSELITESDVSRELLRQQLSHRLRCLALRGDDDDVDACRRRFLLQLRDVLLQWQLEAQVRIALRQNQLLCLPLKPCAKYDRALGEGG